VRESSPPPPPPPKHLSRCVIEKVSDADVVEVTRQTCAYMQLGHDQQLDAFIQSLAPVLEGYNVLTRSLLLKRVESTLGRHICRFFSECAQGCRYSRGGYAWSEERLAWKPLDIGPSRDPNNPAPHQCIVHDGTTVGDRPGPLL
jgi:hypothetical protein